MALALRSSLLARHGFAHGFSTREGGASEGAFASLNLGRTVGDTAEAVEENHRRLARAIEYDVARLHEVSQVHSARWVRVESEDVPRVRREEADALVTRLEGVAIGVRTADCVPILIADRETGAVAAIHAGWRGVVSAITTATIDALVGDRSRTSLVAAIGPHIRVASFEIGDEVRDQLVACAHEGVVAQHGERWHGDLALALRDQLLRAGLDDASIDDIGGDTLSEPARYFSHRRDRGVTGRHLSVIVARGR